jgi:hypothetical protein
MPWYQSGLEHGMKDKGVIGHVEKPISVLSLKEPYTVFLPIIIVATKVYG